MCKQKSYLLIASLIAISFVISCNLDGNREFSQDYLENDTLLTEVDRCIQNNIPVSNMAIINGYLKNLERGRNFRVLSYFSNNIELVVAGDPVKVPFAGTYNGIKEVISYLKKFYRSVNISELIISSLTEPQPNYLEAYIRIQGKVYNTKKTIDIEFKYTWQMNEKHRISKITITYPLISMELAFTPGGEGNIVADLNTSEEAKALTDSFLPIREFVKTLPYEVLIAIFRAPAVPPVLPEDGQFELITINGLNGELVSAEGNVSDKIILNFHGGAFLAGSAAEMRYFNYLLAKLTNIPVLCPEFRLAAENPFPAGLEDCLSVYEALLNDYEAGNIAFLGTSSGGNFVFSTMLLAKENNLPLPGAGISLSPWLDLSNSSETMVTNMEADTLLSKIYLDQCSGYYLTDTGVEPTDPLVSPLFGDVTDFPPIYLTAGADEVLLGDSTRMFNLLAAQNVNVTIEIASEIVHVWPAYCIGMPDSARTMTRIANFITEKLN